MEDIEIAAPSTKPFRLITGAQRALRAFPLGRCPEV
jgi:hypothetical protein